MQIWGVGQAVRILRELLESVPGLDDLWIAGEVSNLSRSVSGHYYLTLKDGDGQLKSVYFRGGQRREALACLQQGANVVAHGRISVYEASGALQFYLDDLFPAGIGRLHLEFERLRAQLEAEGLFSPERKRPLPPFPRRIGVVTSPTGAVLHDIRQVLARRYPLAQLVLAPAAVQGETAPDELAAALEALGRQGDVDVVILARGGGSLEDLAAFNHEAVARAVFACPVPVVTGIGHETDTTIVDYVADVRAPTPSAAAELVVPDASALRQELDGLRRRLVASVADQVGGERARLQSLSSSLRRLAPGTAGARQRVDSLGQRAAARVRDLLALQRERLNGRRLLLESLSPLRTLERGYAIVRRPADGVVRSPLGLAPAERLEVYVAEGRFAVRVAAEGGERES